VEIMTVLGPVSPDTMGITLPHEHLLIDVYEIVRDYGATLDDEDLAIEELNLFKNAGGRTVVDLTSIGIGRDPLALKRISVATGVQVIMGSGWYREAVYPSYIQSKSVDELAEMILHDLESGVDGTGIKPGVIGEIGTERGYITPSQERVFRAAARAHKKSGRAIVTHCTHLGELAMEQLALLREEGVDPRRVIISHMGDRRHIRLELPVVKAGAYVSFDHIGLASFQHDSQRAKCVLELIKEGYLRQILLSHDICFTSHLRWYGGRGYDFLLVSFVPMLKAAGLDDEQIHTILVENPCRAFAY